MQAAICGGTLECSAKWRTTLSRVAKKERLRAHALADEGEAAEHDQHRPDHEGRAHGLAERDERDRHRDERRDADEHRGP